MKNEDVHVEVQDQLTKKVEFDILTCILDVPYTEHNVIQDLNKISISYLIPIFCAFELPHLLLYFLSIEHVFLNEYKRWLNFKLTFGAFLKTPYTPGTQYGTLFCDAILKKEFIKYKSILYIA